MADDQNGGTRLTTNTGDTNDLTSYLLGERSELRPLLEAIAATQDAEAQGRAAAEYLLVLAAARYAANSRAPEQSALTQIRGQYERTLTRDRSEHARLLRELYASLKRRSATDVTTALKLLGLYHRRAGHYRLARASFAAAVELAKQVEDPIERLNALFWLGVAERYLGNLDAAEEIHHEQMAIARRIGQPAQVVLAQNNLGLVALRRGHVADAREMVLRALNRAQDLGDRELQGNSYHCLMVVEIEAGRPGEAAACGWQAYQRYESLDQRLRALQDCAVIMFQAGLFEPAHAAYEIVLSVDVDSALRIRSRIGIADVAAAQGKGEEFDRAVQDLIGDPALADLAYEQITAQRSIGLGYASLGNLRKARHHLIQSLTLAKDLGYFGEADETEEVLTSLPTLGPVYTLHHAAESDYARLNSIGDRIIEERARRSA